MMVSLTRRASRPARAAAACAFFIAATAGAQPAAPSTVIVTGSLLPRSSGAEIAAASVLDRATLDRAGVRDLAGALALLGVVQVEQQGGPGTLASVRLRGADSRDTLVLLDGVPITDVTSGQAPIAALATADIERIEVVRGNLSALYGGNATGGVIQVFTRRGAAAPFAASGEAGAGSRATRAANASIAAGSAALRARLTLGAERSDGYHLGATALANPDADGYRRRHAALALDGTLAPGQSVSADLRWAHSDADYDDPAFGTPTDTHRNRVEQRALALAGRHAIGGNWQVNWRAAGNEEQRQDFTVTGFGPFDFGNTLHNRLVAIDLSGEPAAGWRVLFGAERLRQSTDNPTYLRRSRNTDTLRAGVEHEAAWGTLQAGVRRDDSSDFGGATTALVGGRWRLDPAWSVLATVSTSYTPPTLDFLFFDCSPFGFACNNPNLRPERARSAEAAMQWASGAARLRATLFAARLRDKIASDANFVPQNVARARNHGIELTGSATLHGWRLAGEATWQDAIDQDSGERLARRPRTLAALRAGHDIGALSLDAALRHVGSRSDGAAALPAYALLDVSLGWRVSPQWTLRARIDNLADRRYETTLGYLGRPRGVFVSLGWQQDGAR